MLIKAKTPKPPRYPFSLEIKYSRNLTGLVETARKIALEEIELYGPEIIEQANIAFMRKDAISLSFGWGKLLADIIGRIVFGVTQKLLETLNSVAETASAVNLAHRQDFIRQSNQAYGRTNVVRSSPMPTASLRGPNPFAVNILNNEPTLPALLSAWEQNNLALIKSIPENLANQLRSAMTDAFVNGTNMKDLAKIVEDRTGVAKSRAQLIARDQIGKLNGQLSAMRQRAAGIDSYQWITMRDERVRPKHKARDGKIYKWSDGDIKPGQEIRCLTGKSIVDFSNGCNRIWRRRYTGKLTRLIVENGFVFESTPNHPILTGRGWLAADELELGDYIIYSIANGEIVPKHNNNGRVASIEYAFESLANVGAGSVSLISESDFHGDGIKGEVNVVNFDRLLSGDDIAKIFNSRRQFDLAFPDDSSSACCFFEQKFSSSYFSGRGDVSGQVKRKPLLSGEVGPPNFHGVTGISGDNIIFSKNSVDDQSFNTKLLGETFNASTTNMQVNNFFFRQIIDSVGGDTTTKSGNVNAPSAKELADMVGVAAENGGNFLERLALPYKALRIVKKSSSVFIGHVYNLETELGWYIADGVVTHNCRCVANPIFPDLEI